MTADEKLVYMANQIAAFFAAQGTERATVGVAEHLLRFWDPQMRRRLLSIALDGTAPINPTVRNALTLLKSQSANSPRAN